MHKIIKFNFTTYDMRRDQDVVNPRTSHCNVMVLAQPDPHRLSDEHPFLYGRVLGVFHVNVIYSGPGAVDHEPQRFDCLWVRWYDLEVKAARNGTQKSTRLRSGVAEKRKVPSNHLDRLSFLPWEIDDGVGFIDPADVLRGCHIIPAFSTGKSFPNGGGLSGCAHDSEDWNAYYISR